jgi:transcription initiation factor TFIIIB Brf1 subunit/transcription initiation factor TFIIB
LAFRFDVQTKQKEIAKKLGSNEVTIRTYYRKWLEEFPDLFLDVIGKLAQHKELKYFVLLELNQKGIQPLLPE